MNPFFILYNFYFTLVFSLKQAYEKTVRDIFIYRTSSFWAK